MNGSCEYYEALISRQLDGDLSASEEADLRAHMDDCPRCRALAAAMADISTSLREDLTAPPVELREGVMARIREDDIEQDRRFVQGKQAPRRRWSFAALAACLVVILGLGLFASVRDDASSAVETADYAEITAVEEITEEEESSLVRTAVPEDSAESEDAGIEEPDGQEEESAAGAVYDTDDAFFPATYSVSMASLDEDTYGIAEYSLDNASDESAPSFTKDNPAEVPAGRDAEFEALLDDIGWLNGEPDEEWTVFCAIEYQGVVYEFITDASTYSYLLWRDAEEGTVYHSSASPADVFSILDG